MPKLKNSSSNVGGNSYKHTGRYNETTTASKGKISNDASAAIHQGQLVTKGKNNASYSTLDQVLRKKGLIE